MLKEKLENIAQEIYQPWLKKLKINKKTAHHPKACSAKRSQFQVRLKKYKSEQRTIVYLDESGFKADTYRPYGYVPIGHWSTQLAIEKQRHCCLVY